MTMEMPITDQTVIDVPATVDKLGDIIPLMLAGHALTGCDNSWDILWHWIGYSAESDEAECFASCYGQSTTSSMSKARINVWLSRV